MAKKSIVALLFGILGMLTFWVPFFGTLFTLIAIIVSKSALNAKKEGGKLFAVIGLMLGIIFFLVSLAALGMVIFFVGSGYVLGKLF